MTPLARKWPAKASQAACYVRNTKGIGDGTDSTWWFEPKRYSDATPKNSSAAAG